MQLMREAKAEYPTYSFEPLTGMTKDAIKLTPLSGVLPTSPATGMLQGKLGPSPFLMGLRRERAISLPSKGF